MGGGGTVDCKKNSPLRITPPAPDGGAQARQVVPLAAGVPQRAAAHGGWGGGHRGRNHVCHRSGPMGPFNRPRTPSESEVMRSTCPNEIKIDAIRK